jgi:hypothetical protein
MGINFYGVESVIKFVNEALIVGKEELQDSFYKLIGDTMAIETSVPNEQWVSHDLE